MVESGKVAGSFVERPASDLAQFAEFKWKGEDEQVAENETGGDFPKIAAPPDGRDEMADIGNPVPRQSESNLSLRATCSVAVLLAFGCVILIGGHGIGAGFMLFLPFAGDRADLQTCLAWGCASVAVLSHALSSPKIGAIARLLAFGALAVIGLRMVFEFVKFNPRSQPITLITSAPFVFLLTLELVVDCRLLYKRSQKPGTYTFTIRDLCLATCAAIGFVLPAVLF